MAFFSGSAKANVSTQCHNSHPATPAAASTTTATAGTIHFGNNGRDVCGGDTSDDADLRAEESDTLSIIALDRGLAPDISQVQPFGDAACRDAYRWSTGPTGEEGCQRLTLAGLEPAN
ncbi:hypothetical protein GCM10010178_58580 [Lentzea flava]|uniref:Uncharacterized protein n=1 Tax=Lentzea flava TaxID=103732 RepID=A0ABQ2UZY7_9PSEU|nr:hypothetical protein GCM10010178_58580 [Lentzea flava]